MLISHNAPGHPYALELTSDDKHIFPLYLSLNCAPILQPMDQHVIQVIKLNYNMLLNLMMILHKIVNIKEVVVFLDGAWQRVRTKLLEKS